MSTYDGPEWRRATPRVAILSTYLPVGICFHHPDVPSEVIDGLPREKQAWFRQPWMVDFKAKPPRNNSIEGFVNSSEPPVHGPSLVKDKKSNV